MKTKVGINGFGRIGKAVLKATLEHNEDVEVIAINSTSGPQKHAHIFKYDSLYGKINEEIRATEDALYIGNKKINFTRFRDPADIPWGKIGVDIVVESTGLFLTREEASKHIQGGAKKVIITAPAKSGRFKCCYGVNENEYDQHHILSNVSCDKLFSGC